MTKESKSSGVDQEVSRPEAASLINDKHHEPAPEPMRPCQRIVVVWNDKGVAAFGGQSYALCGETNCEKHNTDLQPPYGYSKWCGKT